MIVPIIMFVSTKEMARPIHQPKGVRLRRTSELILSVTEPKVCPGSMTAGVTCMRVSSYGSSNLSMKLYAFSSRLPLRLLLTARCKRVVRIANRGEVGRPGPRVEVGEESVVALLRLKACDAARRVVQVAEDYGLGRARLLARGLYLAVSDFVAALLRLDLCELDALDAVGALLHHAARAHTDFGVAHHLVAGRVPVLIEEEVEAPDFVRAVVRAVARADAAVVDHVVRALGAVHGGVDGADAIARRVFAVHTGNGHEIVARRILDRAAEDRVNSEPVHLLRAREILL